MAVETFVAVLLLGPLAVSTFVLIELEGRMSNALRLVLAALTCVPTFLILLALLLGIDLLRGVKEAREDFGLRRHHLLFGQALVFLYAPMVAGGSGEGGPPLAHVGWRAGLLCLGLAAGFAYAGWRSRSGAAEDDRRQ